MGASTEEIAERNAKALAFSLSREGEDWYEPGLTKREYAAIHVAGQLAATLGISADERSIAARAVRIADALLAELARD